MTPRDEFVDLLRDQMTTACFNRNLIANMFHSDFKYHLKAIDMLTEVSALLCIFFLSGNYISMYGLFYSGNLLLFRILLTTARH